MPEWVRDQTTTRLFCFTDSMCTLMKIYTGMLYAEWVFSINQSNLQNVRWIFCQGHTLGRGAVIVLANCQERPSTFTLGS